MTVSDSRSPTYPQMNLAKCVELLKRLYEGAHRGELGASEAQQLMGFAQRSGSGLAALSSLKKFGLIEGRDPKIRITDLGLRILEPVDDTERADAIERAAREPSIFSDILDSFQGRLPADSVIRARLIRERGFTSGGADAFVRSFKETFSFAAAEKGEVSARSAPPSDEQIETPGSQGGPTSAEANPSNFQSMPASADETVKLRLSPETTVTISFAGRVTRDNMLKLSRLLEVLSDSYD